MDQEQNIEPALAAFTEEERQEAMVRFAVLRPHESVSDMDVGLFKRLEIKAIEIHKSTFGTLPN